AEELPTYARRGWARVLLRRAGTFLDAQVPRRASFCIAVTDELGALLRRARAAPASVECIAPTSMPGEGVGERSRSGYTGPICYAGNLDGYQNLALLFDAFMRVRARCPHARLVLLTHEAPMPGSVPAGVDVLRAESYAEVHARLAEASIAVCPRTERSGFPMK